MPRWHSSWIDFSLRPGVWAGRSHQRRPARSKASFIAYASGYQRHTASCLLSMSAEVADQINGQDPIDERECLEFGSGVEIGGVLEVVEQ